MKKVLVIIPTYNESENILNIIPEVLKKTTSEYEFNVFVIDDNSPDGTAELAEDLNNPNVFIIKREKKDGIRYSIHSRF